MKCDKYENALLLAAASNRKLDAKLASHLEQCPTCRKTLRGETELLSRIDSALRARVNEGPRPGFLAQLRVQVVRESTAQGGSDRVWHVAGAALALALLAMFYPFIHSRYPGVHGKAQTLAVKAPQNFGIRQPTRGGEEFVVRSRHHSKRPAIQRVASREPEVLVPPDEQKAFAQFVACVARRDAMAEAAVTPAANKTVNNNTELPRVPSGDVADLLLARAGQDERIDQNGSSE